VEWRKVFLNATGLLLSLAQILDKELISGVSISYSFDNFVDVYGTNCYNDGLLP